jgi:hypothetical protein
VLLSPKEKRKVDTIEKILAGFRPGERVLVARNNEGTRGKKGVLINYEVIPKGWNVRLDSGHIQFYYTKNLDLI